jgi:hypothetical protein
MDELAKKPTGTSSKAGRSSRKDVKGVALSLGLLAAKQLSDPEVRAKIAEHSKTVLDNANQWRAERSAQRAQASPGGVDKPTSWWSDRVGRRKRERRVDRLRSSVLSLGEGRPELARSLDPVLAALEEVTSAIEVAELRPLPKRVRAYQKVDRVLDELEAGLFDAALPQVPRTT